MTRFNIVPMKVEDLDFFLEIRNECRNYLEDNSRYVLHECRQWFLNEHPRFFIINVNDEASGYFRTSNWNPKKSSVWIGADIHESFRGKKLAYPAYCNFLKMLRSEGYNTFYLSVLSHNARGFNLYKKLGFNVVSIDENVYIREGKPINRINMELTTQE